MPGTAGVGGRECRGGTRLGRCTPAGMRPETSTGIDGAGGRARAGLGLRGPDGVAGGAGAPQGIGAPGLSLSLCGGGAGC